MRKLKLASSFAMAALLFTTAAIAGFPQPGPNTWLVNGTYGLEFNGGYYDYPYFIAGSGSITFNGAGKVTGGVIHCNAYAEQYTSTITGGSYTVGANNTGTVTINTTGDDVCSSSPGVDLNISVVLSGAKIRFSSTAITYDTGEYYPFAGQAER